MFIDFRERGKRGKTPINLRNIDWLLPVGTLTGDRTGNLLTRGTMLQATEPHQQQQDSVILNSYPVRLLHFKWTQALARWLSWLEHRPIHQKVVGLIPG